MKILNEMKQDRASKIKQMDDLLKKIKSENRTKDSDETKLWDSLNSEVEKLDEDIKREETQEELNKRAASTATPIEVVTSKPIGVSFRDWLKESVENKGQTPSFRADPILSSTDTAIVEKQVASGVDILKSPAEAFLRQIGVTFFTGLTNTLVLPSMAEDTGAFPGENTSAASASMATSSLTLAPRRVSHSQSISKETLAQVNPTIYATILQNLVDGVWNAVTNDVFDTLQTDAPGQRQTAGITYAQIAGFEASLAYSNIGGVSYVTTPANKATLKTTAKLTNQAPIWGDDNTVLGYPAYAVPAANSTMAYMGNFSKMAVAQFGGIEIIVDPYTDAKKGLINVTAVGLFDTGCYQPKAIVWNSNA